MKKQALFAATLLLLAGCSADPMTDDAPDGRVPIRLTGGIEVQTRAHTDMDAQFPAGRNVAFWVDNAATGEQLYGNNVLRSDGSDGFTGGEPMFFPQEEDAVDIYALHTNAALTETFPEEALTHTVASDQRAAGDYHASDLLYAANRGVAKTTSAVPLTFYHMLSKVRIAIAPGTPETDLAGAKVEIVGTKTSAAFTPSKTADPTDRTVRATMVEATGSAEDITLDNAVSADFRVANVDYNDAVVVPQTVAAGGDFIRITLAGNTVLTWRPTATLTLESGKRYTYEVTVTMTGLKVSAVVSDWEDWTETFFLQEEANSYMVRPNSDAILIPVSRANKAAYTSYNLGADATGLGGVTTDNYTVELVWGDTPIGADGVITSLETRTVGGAGFVYVKPGIAGNAVIAIRDKDSGTIKWSWHIWVTEPVTSATDNVSGLTWMDRNLGAAGTTYDATGKNGLFYQWGRKDAFPGSDGTNNIQQYYTQSGGSAPTNANSTGSYTELPDMVQNPMNFATNNTTYTGSAGDNSWSNSGAKTIYDPCPPGWKMPPEDGWGSGSDWGAQSNTGRVFNGIGGTAGLNHFYPAAGCRYYNNVPLLDTSDHGNYWSASPNSATHGRGLHFYSTTVHPSNNHYRAFGFSVRCVSE